uniref:Uncharacterized protein n=1 Tax=Rhizobium meliloti TaxID=382 RepID=I2E2F5_RHIML|nr:short hypothetical protein [Sinorhizobium meliloti]
MTSQYRSLGAVRYIGESQRLQPIRSQGPILRRLPLSFLYWSCQLTIDVSL